MVAARPIGEFTASTSAVGATRDDFARAGGSSFPFAALAGELYSAGVGRGLGQEDFATVLAVVEGVTGSDPS